MQQNTFKIVLKQLEDSLLARLSAASGNFLGDTALVENLETTKCTATEIEEKVNFKDSLLQHYFLFYTHSQLLTLLYIFLGVRSKNNGS